jgi:hypothetical protein
MSNIKRRSFFAFMATLSALLLVWPVALCADDKQPRVNFNPVAATGSVSADGLAVHRAGDWD